MSIRPARAKHSGGMRSTINWVVLGLVIERQGYAYDLVQRCDRDYGDVVKVSSESQVYAGLNSMLEKGLIEEVPGSRTVRPGASRQPKPAYRATRSGILAYEAWLATQADGERRQAQLFIRQLAGFAQREPDAALEIVARYEQSCLDRVVEPVATTADPGGSSARLRARLTREQERQFEGARLSVAQFARREVKALLDGRPEGP